MDLTLNNLQQLICHETKPNQFDISPQTVPTLFYLIWVNLTQLGVSNI